MREPVDLVQALTRGQGVILLREHPELIDVVKRRVACGQLVTVLPGVYVPAEHADDLGVRLRAAARWDPDAVLLGRVAARLSFWPGVTVDRVELAVRNQRRPQRGFAFSRRRIPPELVSSRHGIRHTSPSLTALDLSDLDHTDAIDTALRTRAVTLDSLHEALRLSPYRRGNGERRRVLLDSRAEPWSRAERLGHRLLRRDGITGWKANVPVYHLGFLYYIDIAFEAFKLAVEIDGRFHENDPAVFEADRWRQNALALSGWLVLRFTWPMLRDHPEHFVQTVRRGIAERTKASARTAERGLERR